MFSPGLLARSDRALHDRRKPTGNPPNNEATRSTSSPQTLALISSKEGNHFHTFPLNCCQPSNTLSSCSLFYVRRCCIFFSPSSATARRRVHTATSQRNPFFSPTCYTRTVRVFLPNNAKFSVYFPPTHTHTYTFFSFYLNHTHTRTQTVPFKGKGGIGWKIRCQNAGLTINARTNHGVRRLSGFVVRLCHDDAKPTDRPRALAHPPPAPPPP